MPEVNTRRVLAADDQARDLDRFLREECGMSLATWSARGGKRASVAYGSDDGRQAAAEYAARRINRVRS